ncbi:hypothetical protein PFISCL1PPCAC_25501, partial [Pristionchus fissidentatus]
SSPQLSQKMCCCCGCCVNDEPISKRNPPPTPTESGKSDKNAASTVTQQPGVSKAKPVGSTEQKTKKDSDGANYENVSIVR